MPGLHVDVNVNVCHMCYIFALSYIMKSGSASWLKDCEFQFRTLVVRVSSYSIALTLCHFNGDFSVNGEEKCSVSDILLTDDLFPFL